MGGDQFGSHHAVVVVESFYENVKRHTMEHRGLLAGEQEQNVVLQFKPEPAQTMYIAGLLSHWTDPTEPDLRGFAAITDEPPADVATAGHDRCIINFKPEHVEAWLTPENRSTAELQSMLSDRAILVFRHETLANRGQVAVLYRDMNSKTLTILLIVVLAAVLIASAAWIQSRRELRHSRSKSSPLS